VPLAVAIRDFLMQHPGAALRASDGKRGAYSDLFRRHIIGLLGPTGPFAHLDLEQAAQGIGVPLETLRDWLSPVLSTPHTTPSSTQSAESTSPHPLPDPVIALIINQWKSWCGSLTAFRKALLEQHRIKVSCHVLRQILELTGHRCPRPRRPGPDPEALRDAMERFFPNAQVTADGKQVSIVMGDTSSTFCWELVTDVATGAHVGLRVRDNEDSQGLLEALDHAQQTAGSPPIALLTDNKPSNHCEEVQDELERRQILDMPTTPARPQNKATVEGAFGLFAQSMPPIVLPSFSSSPRKHLKAVLFYILFAFCAGRNLAPRGRFGGRTARDLFFDQEPPTDEERQRAYGRLLETKKRILEQQDALRNRLDPSCRQFLSTAFERLGLSDPKGHFVNAIARLGFDAASEAVAIFSAKKAAATIPPADFPERYLLAIATNVAHRNEDRAVYRQLLDSRSAVCDQLLAPLLTERARLSQLPPTQLFDTTRQRFFDADTFIDRHFWWAAVTDAISLLPGPLKRHSADTVARQVACSFAIPHRDRDACIAELAALVVPL
jgi:transposase InsO family protein